MTRTKYFCEHVGNIPAGEEIDCLQEATRLITIYTAPPTRRFIEDDIFLCHQHTLEWLQQDRNRDTVHDILSLTYPEKNIRVSTSTKEEPKKL